MSESQADEAEQGSPESFKPQYLLVRKWRQLASRRELVPGYEPDSELVQDMRSVGNQIISDSLQVGLLSAVEHLLSLEPKVGNLVRGAHQPLAPFHDFSTARAALVSAVKAVWCLAPEEREGPGGRVHRMLSVESDELRGKIGFYEREAVHASPDVQGEFRAAIELYRSRRKGIKERMGRWPESVTTMIKEAAEYLNQYFWRAPPHAIIMGEWQLGSAVAHGHSWPSWSTRNVRDEVVRADQDRQEISRTVEPTPKEFYRTLAVATCMTEIGLGLWNHRATVK